MRRLDLHFYPGTPTWVRSQGPFAKALAEYWNKPWDGRPESDVVADARAAGLQAVLVAFDIESIHGAPPMTNQEVAAMRDRHPDVFVGAWGAVDPFKGEDALREVERAVREDGILGLHFHPIMGRYRVDSDELQPLFALMRDLGLVAMVDVGTTGMGAGLPGGLGSLIENAHPLAIDRLAAEFPELTIIASHPGWPWVDEMTAVALHKGNVFWELSGWAPKYFSPQLKVDIRARLQDKIMFGSDHPSIPFDRLLREWDELGYSDTVMNKVFHENAERVLGI
ncbi:amidohydrolase family protein [Microbacterium enclense]|uniref:amidohydrolase family protein n=1 Tax=Microbacterium enclense TaxID=993073 RepID=UPI0021A39797|nr:amidohydrolase family protein [Microbacterium enclense]MCT2086866.1 amidohydrolase family protein [Microbacterium enclense]